MHSLGCFFGEGTAIASRRRVVWGFRAGAEQAGNRYTVRRGNRKRVTTPSAWIYEPRVAATSYPLCI